MPLLSIIVPAYNAEKYLIPCVNSILNNSFQDFEILLIDDGSVDQTGRICDGLALKHCQITVFHTENRGLSEARNLGLKHASGELISFIDSDDLIAPDMLENMTKAMTPDVQMSICGFQRCEEGTPAPSLCGESVLRFCTQRQTADALLHGGYGPYAWNKIYRRSILEEKCIRFPKDCRAIEDVYFICAYIHFCEKSVILSKPYYQYIMHPGSIMNTFRCSRFVGDSYMNLPRSWRFCEETLAEIAPELRSEAKARAAMFYQTVLRKLNNPSPEYIIEARTYLKRHGSILLKFPWGFKYWLSGVLLKFNYTLWAFIFRR